MVVSLITVHIVHSLIASIISHCRLFESLVTLIQKMNLATKQLLRETLQERMLVKSQKIINDVASIVVC